MKIYDAIVIGGGVAGMTAAIYLKRANLNVLLIEKNSPGGQINFTNEIENYPGFTKISGPELAASIFMQLNELGVELAIDEVEKIIETSDYIEIKAKNNYYAKKIILATGRKPRKLNLTNEDRLSGNGISWCAICDGPLYKNKSVLVVGGGNSAIEEGMYLSTLAKQVTVINRTEKFRAEEMLLEKLKSKQNVSILTNTELVELVTNDNNLKAVKLINNQDSSTKVLSIDGIFVFIGYVPSEQLIAAEIYDDQGYLVVNNKMQTKLSSVYGCGDAIKKDVYQVTTAVGEGAIAATSLINDLTQK